jgi:hypothetical protein
VEAGREARDADRRAAERARDREELQAARRAMGEALAREIGDRERRRLAIERWGGRIGVLAEAPLLGGAVLGLAAAFRWLWRRLVAPKAR